MLLAKDFIRCYLKRPAREPWEGGQKPLNQVGKRMGRRGRSCSVPTPMRTGPADCGAHASFTFMELKGQRKGEVGETGGD